MKSKASTTICQCNTMRWERSTTGWQRNTTHWQRSTTGWNCDKMRWQRNTTHLQCIDNELQRVFKTQRFCVDFSYAGFSQIGSQIIFSCNTPHWCGTTVSLETYCKHRRISHTFLLKIYVLNWACGLYLRLSGHDVVNLHKWTLLNENFTVCIDYY